MKVLIIMNVMKLLMIILLMNDVGMTVVTGIDTDIGYGDLLL